MHCETCAGYTTLILFAFAVVALAVPELKLKPEVLAVWLRGPPLCSGRTEVPSDDWPLVGGCHVLAKPSTKTR